MNKLDSVSRYVSKLNVEQIESLSDEEIKDIRMKRPFHLGQFGFMLDQQYFDSDEHFSQTMYALMKRLERIKN